MTTITLIWAASILQTKPWQSQIMHIFAVSEGNNKVGKSELDSHAYICVAGAAWKVMGYTVFLFLFDVHPYSDSDKPLTQVPVVVAVLALNHPMCCHHICIWVNVRNPVYCVQIK